MRNTVTDESECGGDDVGALGDGCLAAQQFKELLKDLNMIGPETKNNTNQKETEATLLNNLIKLLSPLGSKSSLMTFRNVRATIYAIFNVHEQWMEQQDKAELKHETSLYNRKIWKYKIMLTKLNTDISEALIQSSKADTALLENVPKNQLLQLNESERQHHILRRTELNEAQGSLHNAMFRGKSLCLDKKTVKTISSWFRTFSKSFYDWMILRKIRHNKLNRETKQLK